MNCPHCDQPVDVQLFKSGGKPQSVDASGLGALLEQIHDDELESDFEIGFMKQLRERFAQYGADTRMSEKQMTVVRKIAAK